MNALAESKYLEHQGRLIGNGLGHAKIKVFVWLPATSDSGILLM